MTMVLDVNRFADLIGIPFLEGARFGDGSDCIDCYGLVQEAAKRDGHPFPDAWEAIADDWRRGDRSWEKWTPAGWVWTSDVPRAGDIVVLFDESNRPNHLGYMASDREVLHATRKARSTMTPVRHLRTRIAQVLRRAA